MLTLRGVARRALAALGATLGAAALAPAASSAAFHEVKITEVYPGTALNRDASFVELQMYAPGQTLVGGHTIRTYNAAGAEIHSFTLPGNVANGGNQRTILIGDEFPPDGVAEDFFDIGLGTNLHPSGGAVCFDQIDCVTWGSFAGDPPANQGGPPVAPSGIPDGSSLVRSLAPGCPTLLEGADDTNSSAADFTVSPDPNPRNNSTAPTEADCSPDTVIDKGPRKQSNKRKAKFKFSSPDPGATFECSLDKKPFKPCASPLRIKVKPGRHRFRVRAVVNGFVDSSPATYKFKRKRQQR